MNGHRKYIAWSIVCLLSCLAAQAQMLPVKVGRLWGIIDAQGRKIATPRYDAVSELTDRQAVVVDGGKYGLMDSAGRMLVEPLYTFLQRKNDVVILTNMGGDCQGRDCEGGGWGIINLALNQTLTPRYNLIQDFNADGIALANVGGKCGYDSCDGGKWGLVDTTAREVLPPDYRMVVTIDRTEAYVQSDQGWGIFDIAQQRLRIQPIYEELKRIAPNRVAVRAGKLWGVLDNRGDTLVPMRYDAVLDGGMGYVAYRQGPQWGLVDSTGKKLTAPRFSYIYMHAHGWITVKENAFFGLVDATDHDIIRPDLQEIIDYQADYIIARRDGRLGAINKRGEDMVSMKQDVCEALNDSTIYARNGRYFKWIDNQGKVRKAMTLDSASAFSKNRVAKAKLNGRWGVFNREGNWIVPPKYDAVYVYLEAAKARLGSEIEHFYFNELGQPSKIKRIMLDAQSEINGDDLLNAAGGAAFSGWFFTSQNMWGLREPRSGRIILQPIYTAIDPVPGSNVTFAKAKMKDSETFAWVLIDHLTGKELTDRVFESVQTVDFLNNPFGRVVYVGSEKYALVNLKGQIVPFANAAYIGDFVDGVACVNLGGQMVSLPDAGMDTLATIQYRDRITSEMKVSYRYCRGGKWGYIDGQGKWIKAPDYDGALNFQGDIARVRVKDKWGVVNRNFQFIVEARYDFIELLTKVDGRTYFIVGRDKTAQGFIDTKGEISIKPTFDEVGKFQCGLVKFRQEKLWGYANKAGEIVIAPQFVDAGDFCEGRARVRNARAWGFIDTLGNNVTPQKYLRAGDFHEGLAWVQGEKFFGFVDVNGDMAITPAFSAAGDFSEGLAPAKRKGAYGLIDRQGRWVVQPSYFRIGKFQDSLAVIQEMGTFGLIRPDGGFVVKPMYKEIADFSEGLARFRNGMENGYLDRHGNAVIPSTFSNCGNFSCSRAAIFVQGKWGFIDTAGTVMIPPKYLDVLDFHEGLAAVRLADKWGFVDVNGNISVPIIYERVEDFSAGRAAVKVKDGGWGLVNPGGTVVIPCVHPAMGFRKDGVISVSDGKKWGLINSFGAQMTPCKYDAISDFSEGLAAVTLRRSLGVVDDRGNVLLEPHYDTVVPHGQLLEVEDDDAIGYLDFKGKWIWEPSK